MCGRTHSLSHDAMWWSKHTQHSEVIAAGGREVQETWNPTKFDSNVYALRIFVHQISWKPKNFTRQKSFYRLYTIDSCNDLLCFSLLRLPFHCIAFISCTNPKERAGRSKHLLLLPFTDLHMKEFSARRLRLQDITEPDLRLHVRPLFIQIRRACFQCFIADSSYNTQEHVSRSLLQKVSCKPQAATSCFLLVCQKNNSGRSHMLQEG